MKITIVSILILIASISMANAASVSCTYTLIPSGSNFDALCSAGDIQFEYDNATESVTAVSTNDLPYLVNYTANGYFYSPAECTSQNQNGCVVSGTYPSSDDNDFPYFSFAGGSFYFTASDSYATPTSSILPFNMDYQNIGFIFSQVEPIGTSLYNVIAGAYSVKRIANQNGGYAILFALYAQMTSQ